MFREQKLYRNRKTLKNKGEYSNEESNLYFSDDAVINIVRMQWRVLLGGTVRMVQQYSNETD